MRACARARDMGQDVRDLMMGCPDNVLSQHVNMMCRKYVNAGQTVSLRVCGTM